MIFFLVHLYSLCVRKKGNSACGKKKRLPCGTLVRSEAWKHSEPTETPKRGTNEGGCECLQSGDYKAVKRR
jgi:hypothetical protein